MPRATQRATRRPNRYDDAPTAASDHAAKQRRAKSSGPAGVAKPKAAPRKPLKPAAVTNSKEKQATSTTSKASKALLKERLGAARAARAALIAAKQEQLRADAAAKDLKQVQKVLRALVDQVVLKDKTDARAAKAAEIEQQQFQEMLRLIAPSEQAGTTTTSQAVLRLICTIVTESFL